MRFKAVGLLRWGAALKLAAANQPVQLLDWGDAWMDPTGAALVDLVATDPTVKWEPTQEGAIYPLTTGKALWFRFIIPPARDALHAGQHRAVAAANRGRHDSRGRLACAPSPPATADHRAR